MPFFKLTHFLDQFFKPFLWNKSFNYRLLLFLSYVILARLIFFSLKIPEGNKSCNEFKAKYKEIMS